MICFVFKRGKFYSGKLRLENDSKTSTIALHTSDRRVAQDKLRQIALEREKEAMGLLPPRTVRDAAKRPLNELLAAFLSDSTARGCAPNTLSKYRNSLPKLFERCGWSDLRSVSARGFCEWRARSQLKPKTVNDLLMSARTFFRWLVHQRMCLENPLTYVERDKRPTTQYRRALSNADAQKLLEVAPESRALIYLVALNTGLRRDELRQLRWGDLILEDEKPRLRVRASMSKNRRDAVLNLNRDFASSLLRMRPLDWAPFQPLFTHIPRMPAIRGDMKRAGIPTTDDQGRTVDLHSLRMTYGTNLTTSGASPRVVMELMRHSDIKLTMKIYTDAAQLPLSAAVEQLPAFRISSAAASAAPGDRREGHGATSTKVRRSGPPHEANERNCTSLIHARQIS